MKYKFISIVSFCLMLISSTFTANNIVETRAASSYSGDFYDSISTSDTGNTLLRNLQNLLLDNHSPYNTYDDVGRNQWQQNADRDPNNSSMMQDFYTQTSISYQWSNGFGYNREHVWPQSKSNGLFDGVDGSDKGAGSDVLHIRPTIPVTNSTRGSLRYSDATYNKEVTQTLTAFYHPYGFLGTGGFEPLDKVKGDVARIVLYVYTHYSTRVGGQSSTYKGDLDLTDVIDASSEFEAFSLLNRWHHLDPVSTIEVNRNNYAEGKIGVRNPFVDMPEYVDKIISASSRSIIIPSTATMFVGDTFDLEPKYIGLGQLYSDYYLEWTSTDWDKVQVNYDGTITANGKGNVTIGVVAKDINTNAILASASCNVVVIHPDEVSHIIASPESTSLKVDETQQISLTILPDTAPKTVTYESNDELVATVSSTGLITGTGKGTTSIKITSTQDTTIFDTISVSVRETIEQTGTPTFKKINNISQLESGHQYLIGSYYASTDKLFVLGNIKPYDAATSLIGNEYKVSDDKEFELTGDYSDSLYTISSSGSKYTITSPEDKFLATEGEKKLSLQTSSFEWNIEFNSTMWAELYITENTYIQYNAQAGMFSTYSSNQGKVQLYKAEYPTPATLDEVVTYILAENNTNQCYTRFYVARDMILTLSSSDLNEFKMSFVDTNVLARDRYLAWATSLDENPYSNSTSLYLEAVKQTDVVLISTILISVIFLSGVVIVIKKKKIAR